MSDGWEKRREHKGVCIRERQGPPAEHDAQTRVPAHVITPARGVFSYIPRWPMQPSLKKSAAR